MNNTDTAKILRQKAAKLLGAKCAICHKQFGQKFHFHHKIYKEHEKTYRDFKSSIHYNIYICPRIIQEPKRFSLLCQSHHRAVEMMKRWEPLKFKRLAKIVNESHAKNMEAKA